MIIFDVGLKLLIALISIFYLIFACLCYVWSAMHEKRVRMVVATIVPLLYSFKIFVMGVVVLAAISLLLEFFQKPNLFSF